MSDPLSDRAPPARPGVSSSDSDPECPDSERRFAAGHVRLGRWPLPRIPSGVTCFAFSRQAYCGRAGPSLYQLHLVHTRKGSSPLHGHSHPCCCRSVIFSRSSKVLLSRIYSTNASLRERLAAPVLGFSWNSVPIFYCACWIAVGLATLSAFLSVLHLCRPATLLVDFLATNFHRLCSDVRPILHIRRTACLISHLPRLQLDYFSACFTCSSSRCTRCLGHFLRLLDSRRSRDPLCVSFSAATSPNRESSAHPFHRFSSRPSVRIFQC